MSTHRIRHPDVIVEVETDGPTSRMSVWPRRGKFVPVAEWETSYPVGLIEEIVKVKGASVCDEIMRDEDPRYVERSLRWDVLSYIRPDALGAPSRILDFGSGAGASSMVLTRLFPKAEITGIELSGDLIALARRRATHHGVDHRTAFHQSPAAGTIPANIGTFDYVILSAVYEHFLPDERRLLLPQIWSLLKPGGLLFINQTPWRWFPVETHTTGLPLINYLPAPIALRVARLLSRRVARGESWDDLLRRGIRGGTLRELTRLPQSELVSPVAPGIRDRIDLWFAVSGRARWRPVKRAAQLGMRAIKGLSGMTVTPSLALALKKRS